MHLLFGNCGGIDLVLQGFGWWVGSLVGAHLDLYVFVVGPDKFGDAVDVGGTVLVVVEG